MKPPDQNPEQAPSSRLATPAVRKLIDQCVHCGLCLPACPTYSVFGTEMDSPRGRIALMRAAADGRIALNGALAEHIDLCVACRACEPACPSGVKYGMLVEAARIALEEQRKPGVIERAVRRLALRELLPHPRRLRRVARLLRLYQQLRLPALVRRLGFLPVRLRLMESLLPPLPSRYPSFSEPAPALGEPRGTVTFFRGCVQDAVLADVNAATVRLLQRAGYHVEFPEAQTCCGAVALHVGEESLARELARKNIDAFRSDRYTAIVNNAGGCGALLKDYARLLQDDPAYAEPARRFSASVKDLSEFLAEHPTETPRRAVNARVAYVDSCHLRNAQRVIRPPRDLLRAIPGVELVELKRPDQCCGSGGVYNIVEPETANALVDAKMADIAATGADTIVVTNSGCYLQMVHGVRRARLKARVVHLAELLDESYAG